jgi:hypothetical protein
MRDLLGMDEIYHRRGRRESEKVKGVPIGPPKVKGVPLDTLILLEFC